MRWQGPIHPNLALIKDPEFKGEGLEIEVWSLSQRAFGAFTEEVPAPLGIGTVTLDDGCVVKGFICEPYGIAQAEEVTHFGGWRNYLANRK